LDSVAVVRFEGGLGFVLRNPFHHGFIVPVVMLQRFLPLFLLPKTRYLVQDLDFIVRCFNVVLGTFLDLEGDI
jgi:hypothetical protein